MKAWVKQNSVQKKKLGEENAGWMSVTFYYGLRDGWLECALAVNGASVKHSVAGWHDGLQELLLASCALLGREPDATARFQEEPGEFRWRLSRVSANRLRIRIIEFGNWGTGLPDEKGKILFDNSCGLVSFVRAISDGTSQRLAEVTRIANERGKGPGFPQAEFDQLREAIRGHLAH